MKSCGARLALASEFRRWLFGDSWFRQVPAFPGGIELRPVEAFALAAPVEPFEDQSTRMMGVGASPLRIANDAVVVPVALKLSPQGGQDLAQPQAPRLLEPFLERGETGPELLPVGVARHFPMFGIAQGLAPEEVKAKEGEPPAGLRLPPVEFHQRALLDRQFESELGQPFGQFAQVCLCIVLPLEGHDAVIRITPEHDTPSAFLAYHLLDPQVLHKVQIDVA